MFKKSKELNPPPKPLTLDQILADLGTFELPKSESDQPTRHISPNDPNFDKEWWKLFQTFTNDIEHLKTLQGTLRDTKDQLTQRRNLLINQIDTLESEMKTQKKTIDQVYCES